MTAQNVLNTGTERQELVLTRVIDAPRALVFSAWTDPEHLVQWWGGLGFTTRVVKCDLQPGGVLHYSQHGPNGIVLWGKFVYHEIQAPERLVFTSAFSDPDGATQRAPFGADWPMEVMNTLTLTEENGKTTLVLRGAPYNGTDAEWQTFAAALGSVQQGFKGTFDRLDAFLVTMSEEQAPAGDVVLTRIFDAPRELMWRAWTEPEHLMRWWGPEYFTSPACQVDLRVGGHYLFCMRAPDGQDFWSTGVYQEIVEPERLVYTDSFADADGNVVPAAHYGMPGDWPAALLVTVTLEDLGGKTKLTLRQAGIPAGDARTMTVAGWNSSFDKLAACL